MLIKLPILASFQPPMNEHGEHDRELDQSCASASI